MDRKKRSRTIIRTSLVGIACNVLLATFKLVCGLAVHSLSIVTDSINNYSDAASSATTIVGTAIASKPADRRHPFGYGRVEYLSAMVIGILVLYAGISALVNSIRGMVNPPQEPEYSTLVLVLVAVAVLVKVTLGLLFIRRGRVAGSDSLLNSGKDALLDSVITSSTLVGALVFLIWGVLLEQYISCAISLFIINAGLRMTYGTISKILGENGDAKTGKAIRDTVMSFDGVEGVYDLVVNNYGPDDLTGSLYIAIPDTFTASRIDDLMHDIKAEVLRVHNVSLTAIGMYTVNTNDKEKAAMEDAMTDIVRETEFSSQIHGFHMDKRSRTVRFDVVVSFDAKDRDAVRDSIVSRASNAFPDYDFIVTLDTNFFEA